MKRKHCLFVVLLASFFLLSSFLEAAKQPRPITIKPGQSVVAPGYDRSRIEVKFIDNADIGLSTEGVPYDRSGVLFQSSRASSVFAVMVSEGAQWRRMAPIPEAEVDEWVNTAEENLDQEIADINNYFILGVPEHVITEEWLQELNSFDEIEIALAMPLPMPAPAVPPNYQANQQYLGNAPSGFGFQTAWGVPGGAGGGLLVGYQSLICDLEYSWNQSHLDFISLASYLYPPAETPVDPFSDNNHGTAVIGEMVSANNGWGTLGASYESLIWLAPTNFVSGWNIGAAILYVGGFMPPGGVFLIEQQMAGPNYTGVGQNGLVPVEWWASWYNMIVSAVGNGYHVVEAAGNGAENLDAAAYSTGNGGHWPFLSANNSGAIIVGAGAAPAAAGGSDVDRSRLWYSNYGSRVDVQGWGEQVFTTGYGGYYSAEGVNLWYTSSFSGTSSASPLVAACVANLDAMFRIAYPIQHVPPALMRSTLIATGSPQQNGTYPISQHIGPRPDMVAAWAAMPPPTCCLQRGDFNHDGSLDITDLTDLVSYMFSGGPDAPCPAEADIDKSGTRDIADLTFFVDFLFAGGAAPPSC